MSPLPEPEFVRTTITNMDGTLLVNWGDQGGENILRCPRPREPRLGWLFDGTGYTGSTLAGYQDVFPHAVFWTIVRRSD